MHVELHKVLYVWQCTIKECGDTENNKQSDLAASLREGLVLHGSGL